jgi:hypothetical protein
LDKQYILHHIPKSKEGTYYTIDFPMPDGMELVTITYNYKRFRKKTINMQKIINIVDLGIMDANNRFIGWSGSSRHSIFVGPYTATQGYSMVPLTSGTWKIIIGAYKIDDGGLDVNYEISYKKASSRWFAGDLHMHSTASDGKYDIYTLTKIAIQKNLDFIAVSNHNNYSENMHLPVVPGLTLIPAVEWTHYLGHMNFFGVKTPFDNSFVANNEQQMLNIVDNAKKAGAIISANHPRCKLCPYLWKTTSCLDMVEVWNGPMRQINMDAIEWWSEMLKDGRKIPIVGGSDFHKSHSFVRMGNPVTYVYADSPSLKDILHAVSQGHSYITSSVKGIKLELSYSNAIMGDTVQYKSDEALIITAENIKPGVRLELISDNGIILDWATFNKEKFKSETIFKISPKFVYLIAKRKVFGKEYCCAITNPIYFATS